jgi:hypothetical protein
MSKPWDDPEADPMADIRAWISTAAERFGPEKPSFLYVGQAIWDLLGIKHIAEMEEQLTKDFGYPIKVVLK